MGRENRVSQTHRGMRKNAVRLLPCEHLQDHGGRGQMPVPQVAPVSPHSNALASMVIPRDAHPEHQAPETELFPLPLLVGASSTSMKQLINSCLQCTGDRDKDCKA